MTAAATVATAVVGHTPELWVSEKGVLAGLVVGAVVGLVNGVGVAVLRIPSMIWTLATNNVLLGILVNFSGYYAAASQPSPLMTWFPMMCRSYSGTPIRTAHFPRMFCAFLFCPSTVLVAACVA